MDVYCHSGPYLHKGMIGKQDFVEKYYQRSLKKVFADLYVRCNFGMKTRYGIGTMYTMERSFSGAICVFCIHFQPYLHRNSLNERIYHNFNCL